MVQAMRSCKVDGCERSSWAHGLCAAHNKRREAGKPVDGPIRRRATVAEMADPVAVFWSYVDRSAGPDGCWPWTGATADNGYGHVKWGGGEKPKTERTHRVAFLIENGWLPRGRHKGALIVRHSCDNPPCCNPAHLIAGTHVDNTRDAWERGRASPPPDNRLSLLKLTPKVVTHIRRLARQGHNRTQIARRVGLGWTTVNRALVEHA